MSIIAIAHHVALKVILNRSIDNGEAIMNNKYAQVARNLVYAPQASSNSWCVCVNKRFSAF